MAAKSSRRRSPSNATPPPASPAPLSTATAHSAPTSTAESPSWLDSPDPRRRTLARALLVAVWLYVAALWLLALDQNLNWGLFGPKLPPLG